MKLFDRISVLFFIGTVCTIIILLFVCLVIEFGVLGVIQAFLGVISFFVLVGLLANGAGVIVRELDASSTELTEEKI